MENIDEIISKPIRVKLRGSNDELKCNLILPAKANWTPKGSGSKCLKVRILNNENCQDLMILCDEVEMIKYC